MRKQLLRHSYAACRRHDGQLLRPLLHVSASTPSYGIRQVQRKSSLAPVRQPQNVVTDEKPESFSPLAIDRKLAIEGIVPDLSTTRPAPMKMPEAPNPRAWPHSQSMNPTRWDYGYLFKLGKAYLTFYKTGFKNVWVNWKTMKQIKKRMGPCGLTTAACNPNNPKISYNEYELVLRTERDIRKLLPFGLVFVVCGEFTPLVIVALGSSVVPGTCVIPKQQNQDLEKALSRNKEYLALLAKGQSNTISKLYQLGLVAPFKLSNVPILNQISYNIALRQQAQASAQILSTVVTITREGGWQRRSPADMYEFGMKFMFQPLLAYVEAAHARGEEPISDKLKSKLLPEFEKLTESLVNRDWQSIPEDKRVLHTNEWWLGHQP